MLLLIPMESWAVTKNAYHTRSMAVTPTPVRVPTQRVGQELFTLPSYLFIAMT